MKVTIDEIDNEHIPVLGWEFDKKYQTMIKIKFYFNLEEAIKVKMAIYNAINELIKETK